MKPPKAAGAASSTSASKLLLRLVTAGGKRHTKFKLDADATVYELLQQVNNFSGIPLHSQVIERVDDSTSNLPLECQVVPGGRQKVIDPSVDFDLPLSLVGIMNMDTLYASESSVASTAIEGSFAGHHSPQGTAESRGRRMGDIERSSVDRGHISSGQAGATVPTAGGSTAGRHHLGAGRRESGDGGHHGGSSEGSGDGDGDKVWRLALDMQVPTESEDVGGVYHHEIQADNSCLFGCINFLVLNDRGSIADLRRLIVNHIRADQSYTDLMLERPRDEYMRWIQQPDSWGGYLELVIFAQVLEVNIAVFDIQSRRMDLYGEDHLRRIYLLYDGVHYDAVVAQRLPATTTSDFGGGQQMQSTRIAKVFYPWDAITQTKVQTVVEDLNQRRQYVKSTLGSIVCQDCGAPFVDASGAKAHASRTGHDRYAQV